MQPVKLSKKIGGWVEMEFNAEMVVLGVRWFRVKGGMGGGDYREDWVADVPGTTLAVHDYNWKGGFGVRLGKTRKEAMVAAIHRHFRYARDQIAKARKELVEMENGLAALVKAAGLAAPTPEGE